MKVEPQNENNTLSLPCKFKRKDVAWGAVSVFLTGDLYSELILTSIEFSSTKYKATTLFLLIFPFIFLVFILQMNQIAHHASVIPKHLKMCLIAKTVCFIPCNLTKLKLNLEVFFFLIIQMKKKMMICIWKVVVLTF